MIPKKIHFCWYGKGEYNNVIKKCLKSWEEILPDYEVKKWDETNTPFDELSFLKLLYKQKKWAFISDYMRLYALYSEGGVYLDTDIEIIKNIDDLLLDKVFFGFQSDIKTKYPVATGVIGSEKANDFILDCIHEVEKKQKLDFNAMGGPNVISKILFEKYQINETKVQEINGVLLYTAEYFYPLPWKVDFKEAPKYITENSYCIHWWQESWTTKRKDFNYYVNSFYRKIQKLPLLIASSFIYLFNNKAFYYIKK